MTKDQATQVISGLIKILHDKGGIQVTPADYEQLTQAIAIITAKEPVAPKPQSK